MPQHSKHTSTAGSLLGSDSGVAFFWLTLFWRKKGEPPVAAIERHRNAAKNLGADLMHGFDTLRVPCPELVEGSARTGRGTEAGTEFGVGRFRGRPPFLYMFQASSQSRTCVSSYAIHSNPRNRSTILRAYRLATSPTNFGKSTCALSSARSEIVRTDANGKP